MSDQPHQQNLALGIASAIAAALFLTTMNMLSKILVEDLDPIVVGFWRNIFSFFILFLGFIIFRKTEFMKTNRLPTHIVRSVIGTIGFILGIWMFSLMPVTEGTTIGFTSPLFVVLLSYPMLREKVGIYRVLATIIGLFGIVSIVGFDQSNVDLKGYIIGLGFALSNGLVLIMLRKLGKTEHAMTTVFYFMLIGLIMTALYLPFADKIIPDVSVWWVVLAFGIIGLLSLIFKTESYRHAPASVIAPLAYTMLLWSAFFDYLIWNHVAPSNVWIGAAIIIISNIVILWREQARAKFNKDKIPLE